jgi:hypothetical protein
VYVSVQTVFVRLLGAVSHCVYVEVAVTLVVDGLGVKTSVLTLYAYDVLVKNSVDGPQGGADAPYVVEHRLAEDTAEGEFPGQPQPPYRESAIKPAAAGAAVVKAATRPGSSTGTKGATSGSASIVGSAKIGGSARIDVSARKVAYPATAAAVVFMFRSLMMIVCPS